jgi:hypothetical protein
MERMPAQPHSYNKEATKQRAILAVAWFRSRMDL